MRLKVVPALLVTVASAVFALLLSACPGPSQTATVTVACDGSGCGRAGLLHVWLADCASGNVLATADMPGVSLSSSASLTVQLNASPNVDVTTDCVRGFLDVNTNGTLDAGDVMSGNGQVHVGSTQKATFTLDTVVSQPGFGTLFLDVSCSGPACGKSGALFGQAVNGSSAAATIIASDAVHGVTLVAGTSHRVSVSNLALGKGYGRAFLSLGTSGVVVSGDAIMTSNQGIALTLGSSQVSVGAPLPGVAVTLTQLAP